MVYFLDIQAGGQNGAGTVNHGEFFFPLPELFSEVLFLNTYRYLVGHIPQQMKVFQ